MTRWTLRVFGIPVLCVDMYELTDEQETATEIGGGSAHNFELDYYPLSPTAHHEWEWEDKKKGFGFR